MLRLGYVKMNHDASYANKRGTCANVAVDHGGNTIHMATKSYPCNTALIAETIGLWEATKLAEEKNWKWVIFEGDCQILFNAIISGPDDGPWQIENWVKAIKEKARKYTEWRFRWVYREHNTRADELARWAVINSLKAISRKTSQFDGQSHTHRKHINRRFIPSGTVSNLRSLASPYRGLLVTFSASRCSVLHKPEDDSEGDEIGGKVVEVKLGDGDKDIDDVSFRKIAYGSVSPFALLQSRRNSDDWWKSVMEYSKDINLLLDNSKSTPYDAIEDPNTIVEKTEEPTCTKAAWELLEIFYADQESQQWLPERLVDWLMNYDGLLSGQQQTIHSRLVEFQTDLGSLQSVEDDPRYWEAISSATAVGWLEIVVKMLRLHGSYQLDQLGNRETENGLVEAVAVLLLKMPRIRPELNHPRLGECYNSKPDFLKAWENWREQIIKLDCSTFWVQCDHLPTREGLKNMLQIMLGNSSIISAATCNWMELYISHFLYIMPLTVGIESMYNLAHKCIELKPMTNPHRLMRLVVGILEENTEVVLAECSSAFGPWMVSHAIELLTAGSDQADTLFREERLNLGEISLEELHRLVYAQFLSSHALTWQIAPIYLASCMKQGMGLLEILLYRQPVQHNQTLLKVLEICRLYDLNFVGANIMKVAGVHHWKHGRKGYGVFWLQQAHDDVRLKRIAQQLFDFVGKSISDERFKHWEGLIELLGSDSKTAGGLEFLHKYRDFKKSLLQISGGKANDACRQAVGSLISLMKNPSTPQRFWLPLLHDSLKLLSWKECPLLDVSQTNLLLNKLQELSMAKLRPGFIETNLPTEALSTVRLALATNLGRAIMEG